MASDVDVLYMTRIQKERFTDLNQYAQARGKYVINKDIMKQMKKDAVVLHPLPRVDEVSVLLLFVLLLVLFCHIVEDRNSHW